MIVGACTIQLYLPGAHSLKDKRSVIRPLMNQLRRRFEVAAAEVDHQDLWQSAEIAIVTVANEAGHVYVILERAIHWIEDSYRQVEVVDWTTELR
jgi:hypothetical protein